MISAGRQSHDLSILKNYGGLFFFLSYCLKTIGKHFGNIAFLSLKKDFCIIIIDTIVLVFLYANYAN